MTALDTDFVPADLRAAAVSWVAKESSRRDGAPASPHKAIALFPRRTPDEERALLDAHRYWIRCKVEAGLAYLSWPEEWGGQGMPAESDEVVAQVEASFPAPERHEIVAITTDIVAPTLLEWGTEEQCKQFLVRALLLDDIWCQLFSEPSAGSDLASLRTRAVPDGDAWILEGHKVWTSGAHLANFGVAIARTGDDKHAGLTAFIVDMSDPGIEIRPLRQMTGGSSFNEVVFDGVRVDDRCRLGAEGDGWRIVRSMLRHERAASRRESRRNEADLLVGLARDLGRSGDPLVRQELATLHCESTVLALLQARLTASEGAESSLGKLAWARNLQRCAHVAGVLLGPALAATSGDERHDVWAEFVLGAPGYRIAGGSDEIQRNLIAEQLLGLPRDQR